MKTCNVIIGLIILLGIIIVGCEENKRSVPSTIKGFYTDYGFMYTNSTNNMTIEGFYELMGIVYSNNINNINTNFIETTNNPPTNWYFTTNGPPYIEEETVNTNN